MGESKPTRFQKQLSKYIDILKETSAFAAGFTLKLAAVSPVACSFYAPSNFQTFLPTCPSLHVWSTCLFLNLPPLFFFFIIIIIIINTFFESGPLFCWWWGFKNKRRNHMVPKIKNNTKEGWVCLLCHWPDFSTINHTVENHCFCGVQFTTQLLIRNWCKSYGQDFLHPDKNIVLWISRKPRSTLEKGIQQVVFVRWNQMRITSWYLYLTISTVEMIGNGGLMEPRTLFQAR